MDSKEIMPSVPRPRLCHLALASFICGALGVGMFALFVAVLVMGRLEGGDMKPAGFILLALSFLSGLATFPCAFIALRRIRKSNGALRGEAWVQLAYLLGVVWLVVCVGSIQIF